MAVDKFPHTERGIRRTCYPLVPRRDGGVDVKEQGIKCGKPLISCNFSYNCRHSERTLAAPKVCGRTYPGKRKTGRKIE